MIRSLSFNSLKTSLFLLILCAGVSRASIYAIQPVAKTKMRAGDLFEVRWIDSHSVPSVESMGLVKLLLCSTTGDKCLYTLADKVDPRTMSTVVPIPLEFGTNRSDYHIRFISEHPPKTVYTADFTILGSSESSTTKTALPLTPTSTAPTVLDAKQGTQVADEEMITVTMVQTPSAPENTYATGASSLKANSMVNAGRPLRKTSRQINLVFVLWPALFGLALAL